MSFSFEIYIVVALLLFYIDFIIVLKLFVNRFKKLDKQEKSIKERQLIINTFLRKDNCRYLNEYSNSYKKMKDSILLDQADTKYIESCIDTKKIERRNIKKLNSLFKLHRMESAVKLGIIGSGTARKALEERLLSENYFPAKLYIANALSDIGSRESIPVTVESLINAHRWYRSRVNTLIADFGSTFYFYLPQIISRDEVEIKELIVDFAAEYHSADLKSYLIKIIDKTFVSSDYPRITSMDKLILCCQNCIHGRKSINDGTRVCKYKGLVKPDYKCWRFKRLPISIDDTRNMQQLAYRAADVLADVYPKVLDDEKYLNCLDTKISNIAVKALEKGASHKNLDRLMSFLAREEMSKTAVNGISEIVSKNPEMIQRIVRAFINEGDLRIRTYLAEILSRKIEYFIMKLTSQDKKAAADIIEQILLTGKTSEVIDFLNKNKNIDIENELIAIIKNVFPREESLEKEFCRYLNEKILRKCSLDRCQNLLKEKVEAKNNSAIKVIYSVMITILLFFPAVYILRYQQLILKLPIMRQLRTYVIDFNYYIAYYSITINLIYLLLLLLSFINVQRQSKLWELKSMSLLFRRKMLPSISIIAPAFNEEKTIVESANSLLNLIYPDYELIIVNDGSDDRTLDVLMRTFNLKRTEYYFDYKLNTKPIRGVYINQSMPKLIVVDKENGGKADSLNAGINISNKEYFCGIDADSLLEPDALLKLASMEIDSGVETPALGGNIFPANGCTIDKGVITDIKIPKNNLARFQTIEYIRAFMAGRLGWAYTNSLLIISGAFGLFRKERVISVGGYLTSSGKYEKDTVGEDMELVVRISRLMREKGLRYKIDYAYNANCWTEVPEDKKSLKKQRYRWHRGLIDILTFHKNIIFNPKYGRTGLIAMPYFFIFEMVGPLIEIQGYIMIAAALLLGLLNVEIALLLFVSTVLLGILVSLASLLIAEKDKEYFKGRDIAVLIIYCILENFGLRQLFSLWRVGATIRMLWKTEGWGKLERKGFAANDAQIRG